VTRAAERLFALELYHGPTAAFKDFGARFLAESLQRLEAGASQPLTILVATSGDTGGAVAAAFHLRPGVRVVVLYPRGQVSPRQEQQLTCWGDNVISLRIDGTFDDCQRLVKEAFVDPGLTARHRLSSANSINVGRLLPQMVYYVASSLEVERRTGDRACFIIPAAISATPSRPSGPGAGLSDRPHHPRAQCQSHRARLSRNRRLAAAPRDRHPGICHGRGNPSNMERVRAFYPAIDAIREQLSAECVDDATIRARIGEDFMQYGREWCPHTATAAEVYARLSPS